MIGDIFEGEGILSYLYVGSQGVSEVGEIFWRVLGSFFMVDKLGCKTRFLQKNEIGGRHGHRCEEGNEDKYVWDAISLLVVFLNYVLCLNPEICGFTYFGIRWEYCEYTPCSSPLGEASVSESSLTSVGFCTLFEWITWWLRPRWWYPSPV